MEVVSICSRNRIASLLRGAMMSAQLRDFGMLDTSSCTLALTGDKEHQGRRQLSRPVALSRQEIREPNSNRCGNFNRGSVGVQFSVAALFRLTTEQSIQSR